MARYSGKYYKGASKDAKAEKRREAELRQGGPQALLRQLFETSHLRQSAATALAAFEAQAPRIYTP